MLFIISWLCSKEIYVSDIIMANDNIGLWMTCHANSFMVTKLVLVDQFSCWNLETIQRRIFTKAINQFTLGRYTSSNKIRSRFLLVCESLDQSATHRHQVKCIAFGAHQYLISILWQCNDGLHRVTSKCCSAYRIWSAFDLFCCWLWCKSMETRSGLCVPNLESYTQLMIQSHVRSLFDAYFDSSITAST